MNIICIGLGIELAWAIGGVLAAQLLVNVNWFFRDSGRDLVFLLACVLWPVTAALALVWLFIWLVGRTFGIVTNLSFGSKRLDSPFVKVEGKSK